MRTRDYWLITGTLLLVTIFPMLLLFVGVVLNALFGCDIRDEGGEVHGNCADWQADATYTMLIAPWLLMLTVPTVGPVFVVALFVSLVVTIKRALKK